MGGKKEKKRKKKGGGANESIVLGAKGFGLTIPLGFILRFLFPGWTARSETIPALARGGAKKIAAGKVPSPEEQFALGMALGSRFEENQRLLRLGDRAQDIYANEPKLLPAPQQPDAGPVAPSPAWRDHFRSSAGPESDKDVDEMWARILAGEFRRPGSFSFKTLAVLRDTDESTATDFVRLLGFLFADDSVPAWETFKSQYVALGVTYTMLLRLAEAGLIHTHDVVMRLDAPQQSDGSCEVTCNGVVLRLPKVPEPLAARPLTIAGWQLARIANRPPSVAALCAMFEWFTLRMNGSEARVALRAPDGSVTSPFRQWSVDDLMIHDDGTVGFVRG